MAAGEVGAQVEGLLAPEQHRLGDGVEGLGLDRSAGEGGDRLGGDVRLLRGDPAEFDRKIGGVAGGVDTLRST